MTDQKYIMPKAGWRVMLGDKDLTDTLSPRLLSQTLTEKRGGDADQLDIVLDDADGLLDIPNRGAKLRVFMGWVRGTGVPIGLVDKGEFLVDEVCASGPPDIITIRARSAKLTGGFRIRRERSFVNQTVSDIITIIAGDNDLVPRIDPDLAAKTLPALGTGPKSDAVLMKELGHLFDAVATVKRGYLIFSKIGKGTTATGKAIPIETIDRSQTGPYRYTRAERGQYGGVEAQWHDKGSATRHTVTTGGGDGHAKRLRRIYASEAHARHACEGEETKMKRGKAKIEFPLALGRPDYFPDRAFTLSGYKAEIIAQNWLIAEATHAMDGSGGLTTKLSLESISK